MIGFLFSRANRKFIMKCIMTIALSVCFSSLSMAKPSEARLSELRDCQFLGKVEGSSGYGKHSSWRRLAKSSAFRLAEKIGASHVFWERMIRVGSFNGLIVARAYSCTATNDI